MRGELHNLQRTRRVYGFRTLGFSLRIAGRPSAFLSDICRCCNEMASRSFSVFTLLRAEQLFKCCTKDAASTVFFLKQMGQNSRSFRKRSERLVVLDDDAEESLLRLETASFDGAVELVVLRDTNVENDSSSLQKESLLVFVFCKPEGPEIDMELGSISYDSSITEILRLFRLYQLRQGLPEVNSSGVH